MIRFEHICNDTDNFIQLQIITYTLNLEYSIHQLETMIMLRDNLDNMIMRVAHEAKKREELNK